MMYDACNSNLKSLVAYLNALSQFCFFLPTSDQMNPLQNLTAVGGAGGPGTIGMPPRPTGAPMGAMNQMPIGQHSMQGVAGNQQGGMFSMQMH